MLGIPKRNETSCVAFSTPNAPVSTGQKIKQYRLKLRKIRKQFASGLGISQKTLWGWEIDRWQPSAQYMKRFARLPLVFHVVILVDFKNAQSLAEPLLTAYADHEAKCKGYISFLKPIGEPCRLCEADYHRHRFIGNFSHTKPLGRRNFTNGNLASIVSAC
jgi:transcriptional regulator with XRE-family HTH domain